MTELFGWDLIYKLSENDLNKKEDVLTLFVHYILIKRGFKCIGLGDDKVLTGNETTSETLPNEWNNSSSYSIKYFLNNSLYILKGIPVEKNIVYNLLDMSSGSEMKVTNIAFNVENTVGSLKGDIASLIPNHEEVMKKIQTELLTPMGNVTTREATTQASSCKVRQGRSSFPDPTAVPGIPAGVNPIWSDPERDPLRVGRSDLDPLGRGGGGMIFNPFGGRNPIADPSSGLPRPLPRGAVPPGARFDPYGPPVVPGFNPRRPPGSDEFHPPGFGDMFM
uniref:Proteasome inhibitor PI31 subunit n=1 Tax=Riptortus pedestris TaxID=329032 RepID=R4WS17_RIPPE|nr:proteasome inhibitor [Riptortus pedestris]